MKLKIESGIPIPPKGGTQGREWGFAKTLRALNVGQSTFVAGKTVATVWGTVGRVQQKTALKFETRTEVKRGVAGVRVWRVA